CSDVAGNTAASIDSNAFKIDLTDPTISFTGQSPAKNANGWNNTDVSLSWSCSDSGSGPVAASVSQSITSEGSGQQPTGTCADNAGRTANSPDGDVNIDKHAPTITDQGPTFAPDGNNGWYVSAVTDQFKAVDSLSGLDSACVTAFPASGSDNIRNVS